MSSAPHDRPERPAGAPGPPPPASPPPGAASPPPLPRGSAVAAGCAALLGALAVAGSAIGLGAFLTALAVALAALLARSAPRDPWTRVWAALALVLASTTLIRDADWVVIPSLIASLALGSLAMGGGAAAGAVARGLARVFARLPGGPAPVLRTAARVLPGGPRGAVAPALSAAAIAIPLLVVFGALFASADPAFAQIAQDALPGVDRLTDLQTRAIWFALFLALAGALASSGAGAEPAAAAAGPDAARRGRLGAPEWVTALVALDLLFAVFVAVQATVLFGGDERVLDTAGLTYAEYAREGFGQLLVAAGLTLAVVAGALRWARVDTPRQGLLLRALLVLLGALTLVVLASALHRLGLYQDAFGATRWRLTAEATLIWTGVLLVLVMSALVTATGRWLPRGCVLASALALVAFAGSNPDRRIAARNVELARTEGRIDVDYLQGLSADAVPELVELPQPLRGDSLGGMRDELETERGWAELNLARTRAREELR